MNHSKLQREEHNKHRIFVCEELGITKNEYNQVRRMGDRLQNVFVAWCNGDIESEELYESSVNEYTDLVDAFAKEKGLNVYYQTDPRGASIYLSKNEMTASNYPQAGHCIY